MTGEDSHLSPVGKVQKRSRRSMGRRASFLYYRLASPRHLGDGEDGAPMARIHPKPVNEVECESDEGMVKAWST